MRRPLSGSPRARALALLLCLMAMLLSTPLSAHEMSIAELELHESSPGEFLWQWSAQSDKRALGEDLVPHWPKGCTEVPGGPSKIHCGAGGLKGTLSIAGVGKRYSAAIVKITWLDGQSRVYTLTGSTPSVELFGSAEDRRSKREIAATYIVLGVEHILGGIDHLLFVASLLFLVGFRRRLIGTITAFTVAHSLTLASSVFGWITLRSAPVEASIAMSIVLVASEALRERDTLARRLPALVSFLFGLVHGLGFAGALQSVGLPETHLPLALLCFNVGVELGQLAMVLAAYALTRLPVPALWFERARQPALYGIGIVAAYWSWLRVAAIVL